MYLSMIIDQHILTLEEEKQEQEYSWCCSHQKYGAFCDILIVAAAAGVLKRIILGLG